MKNLTFEFQEYDKVININVEMVLFFKKKLSNIEVILHIMEEKETSITFNISNSCSLDTLQAVYIEKNKKIVLAWQDVDFKINMSVYRLEDQFMFNKTNIVVSYNDNKICKAPNLMNINNKIFVFWLESNYYSNL